MLELRSEELSFRAINLDFASYAPIGKDDLGPKPTTAQPLRESAAYDSKGHALQLVKQIEYIIVTGLAAAGWKVRIEAETSLQIDLMSFEIGINR
ncbi:MAG: hypothetical protein HQ526_02820 [Actinobacteria bacterium]|nr:hypothetical protein [Actinomycetota bacterium]